jgi:hypothetical protein
MELEEDLRREASISGKPDDEGKAREPWERDPDWWRRSGS